MRRGLTGRDLVRPRELLSPPPAGKVFFTTCVVTNSLRVNRYTHTHTHELRKIIIHLIANCASYSARVVFDWTFFIPGTCTNVHIYMSTLAFPTPTTTIRVRHAGPPTHVNVGRVFCVGKNYAKHAIEMGCDPEKEPPVFFCKQPANVFQPDVTGPVPFPPATSNLHHEAELVLVIGRASEPNVPVARADAPDYIYGWAVGLDMTRRDVQQAAKGQGLPWDMSKSFDFAAPITDITLVDDWAVEDAHAITCLVNGDGKQAGVLGDMIWNVADIIHYLSTFVALQPGDLIFTGTPPGVSQVKPGDVVTAKITGLPDLRVTYV